MTTPLGATGATTNVAAAQPSAASAAFDKDTFMKLLVAQLKYQNPMQPADNNEYMNQMAVFAQVEKLTALLSSQQDAAAWQQRLSAEGMVGRQVTGTGPDDVTRTGTVTAVHLDPGGPRLLLSDGSTLSINDVTTVEQAPTQ